MAIDGFYDTYLYDFIVCTPPALLQCVRVGFSFLLLARFVLLEQPLILWFFKDGRVPKDIEKAYYFLVHTYAGHV